MPRTGPITQTNHQWSCACGAPADSIDNTSYGDVEPVTLPGPLLQPCTCPRCISCGWALDHNSRCDNLDCPLLGTHIVLPD